MSNKQIIIDVWNRIDGGRELTALDEYFSPDFVRHGRRTLSREGFKEILADLHTGFPDMTSEVVQAVEEGDRVAYHWQATGTHLGPYMGALPTGRKVTAWGVTISRLEDGRIVEDRASWNELSVLHDLGILPIDRP